MSLDHEETVRSYATATGAGFLIRTDDDGTALLMLDFSEDGGSVEGLAVRVASAEDLEEGARLIISSLPGLIELRQRDAGVKSDTTSLAAGACEVCNASVTWEGVATEGQSIRCPACAQAGPEAQLGTPVIDAVTLRIAAELVSSDDPETRKAAAEQVKEAAHKLLSGGGGQS